MKHTAQASRRFFTAWLVLSLMVLGPEVALLHGALDLRPICAIAKEWVAAHTSDLPTEYDTVVAFPLSYRREIYNSLPDAVRGQLWSTQLSRALGGNYGFTAEQRHWLEELVRRLQANGLANGDSREATTIATDVERLFGHDPTLAKLFTQLGPDDGRYGHGVASSWLTLQTMVRQSFVLDAASNECNCTYYSDWCDTWYSGPGYAWCEDPYEYQYVPPCQENCCCGSFWWYQCNGVCAKCEEIPEGSGNWFCGVM